MQVVLTLVAGVDTVTGQGAGADEPGEVDGDLVPAALVRELAHTLGLLARPEHAAGSDTQTDTQTDTGNPGYAQDADGAPSDDECVDSVSSDSVSSDFGEVDSIGEEPDGDGGAAAIGDREREARIAALQARELAAAEELLATYEATDADPDHEMDVSGGTAMRGRSASAVSISRRVSSNRAIAARIAVPPLTSISWSGSIAAAS